jgi:hypothetical protein
MQPKQIFSIVLIIFVLGSLAYMIAKGKNTNPAQNETANEPIPAPVSSPNAPDANVPGNSQLVVYYFHGDVRCPTCHKLESYAQEAVETYFAEKLASGEILWQVVNVDRAENSHYVEDYKLVTKSVILSQITDGKETHWQNLDQIWKKVRSKKDYLLYIKDGVNDFREEKNL